MVFWENVSDNANSTFSMESERVEIKNSGYVYVHQQSTDKIRNMNAMNISLHSQHCVLYSQCIVKFPRAVLVNI